MPMQMPRNGRPESTASCDERLEPGGAQRLHARARRRRRRAGRRRRRRRSADGSAVSRASAPTCSQAPSAPSAGCRCRSRARRRAVGRMSPRPPDPTNHGQRHRSPFPGTCRVDPFLSCSTRRSGGRTRPVRGSATSSGRRMFGNHLRDPRGGREEVALRRVVDMPPERLQGPTPPLVAVEVSRVVPSVRARTRTPTSDSARRRRLERRMRRHHRGSRTASTASSRPHSTSRRRKRTSAGLPGSMSSTQTSSTETRSPVPTRPRRPIRSRAVRTASAEVRPSQSSPSARRSSDERSRIAAESIRVRAGVVHGIRSITHRSPGPSVPVWTRPRPARPLRRRGPSTCGSGGAVHAPRSAAAVRWDAAVSGGPLRHAASASRRHDRGAPATR